MDKMPTEMHTYIHNSFVHTEPYIVLSIFVYGKSNLITSKSATQNMNNYTWNPCTSMQDAKFRLSLAL